MRCREKGTEVVSHVQEQAALRLSAAVSVSVLGEMGTLSGTAGVGTLH